MVVMHRFGVVIVGVAVIVVMIVTVTMPVVVRVCVPVSLVASGVLCHPFTTNLEFRGGDAGAKHTFGPDRVRGYREAAERASDFIERHTGVDERTQDHVTGRTREAVEIENGHDQTILSR